MILLLHELKNDLCKIIALPKIEIFFNRNIIVYTS